MKRFWKKMNRGLLLGGVLLLLLIGFIVLKEVQFRAEVPGIRQTVRDAMEALLELNLSEEETALGQVRTEAVRARQTERMEAVLSQYWDADAETEYYINVGTLRASFEEYLKEPLCVSFQEMDLSVSDREIEVRQNGTDYAVVSVEINSFSARYTGDGDSIFYGEYYSDREPIGIALGQYIGTYNGYAEMELHRKDGEWRVCGMSLYLQLMNKTVADTETEGGEK